MKALAQNVFLVHFNYLFIHACFLFIYLGIFGNIYPINKSLFKVKAVIIWKQSGIFLKAKYLLLAKTTERIREKEE